MNGACALRVSLSFAALLLAAPPAFATGINLHWDDCVISGGAKGDKSDACTADYGAPFDLIATVTPPVMNDVVGIEAVIDLQVDAPDLVDWWRFESGSCRAGALALDLQLGFANPPFSCPEPWRGAALGAMTYTEGQGGHPARGRIRVTAAVPAASPVSFDPAVAPEWYLFRIRILKQNTSSCAGCATPACIVLNSVTLVRTAGAPGGDLVITMPSTNNHATWQGGGLSFRCCPIWCPVEPVTWGHVKGLYR